MWSSIIRNNRSIGPREVYISIEMTWLGQTMSLCLHGVSGRGKRAAVDLRCIVYNHCLPIMTIMIFCCLDGYNVEAKETLQKAYKGGWVVILYLLY